MRHENRKTTENYKLGLRDGKKTDLSLRELGIIGVAEQVGFDKGYKLGIQQKADVMKKEWRKEVLEEVKTKCYSEWRENGTMTWEVFEGIIKELEGKGK